MMTYDEALALLEQTVKDRGEDYIYQERYDGGCYYADPVTGEPSCGVGYAVNLLDPELFVALRDAEVSKETSIGASTAIRSWLHVAAEDKALDLLNHFQERQDSQAKYGEALEHAKRIVGDNEEAGYYA